MLLRFLSVSLFTLLTEALGAVTAPPQQALLISIDGLKPKDLSTLVAAKALSAPYGLSWLHRTGLYSEEAYPAVTTLTAASHVSTLTCSRPAQHQVVANVFRKDGHLLSGFSAPVKTESFVEAARRQAKKVLSIGYVSVDGQSPQRSADWGITYPDERFIGPKETKTLVWSALRPAKDWILGPDKSQADAQRELSLSLVLNPVTAERRTVHLLLQRASLGYAVIIDQDKDLTNGILGRIRVDASLSAPLPLYFQEEAASSGLRDYLRRLDLRFMAAGDRIILQIAGSSYNNAHPPSYRQWLDAQGLVWPSKVVTAAGRDPLAHVEEMAVVDRFLATVAVRSIKQYPADLILFYQPLLDSTEHAYEASLPKPLRLENQDAITQAYLRAWTYVDQNISDVVAAAGQQRAIIAMGDHGMEPVTAQLNLSALVRNTHPAIDVVPAGGLALIYAKDPSPKGLAAADQAGLDLAASLQALALPGKTALSGQARRRYEPAASWHYGDAVWAFMAGPELWFAWAPSEAELLLPSPAGGMHGHDVSLPSMATGFYLRAPGLAPRNLGRIDLLDAVPTLAALLRWLPPKDCVGQSQL